MKKPHRLPPASESARLEAEIARRRFLLELFD